MHGTPRTPYYPTTESFHLDMARSAFLGDKVTAEEYERNVEHVLRGGTLSRFGRIGGPPAHQRLRTRGEWR